MFVLDWLGRRAAPLITRLGLTPRTVTLETIGRTSGKPRRVSVTVARLDGRRYLVGLGGDATPWVRNVRAADGRAVILSGRR